MSKLRVPVDIASAVLIFACMAYFFTGNTIHEWIGLVVVVGLIFHNFINKWWWKNPLSGKINSRKVVVFVLNVLLAASTIAIAVSGAMLSREIFPFISSGETLFARRLHTASAIWMFLLVAIHTGFHANFLRNAFKIPHFQIKALKYFVLLLAGAGCVLGGFAFVRRDIAMKFIAHNTFDKFAFGDTIGGFIFDYFLLAVLFFCVGYLIMKIVSRK